MKGRASQSGGQATPPGLGAAGTSLAQVLGCFSNDKCCVCKEGFSYREVLVLLQQSGELGIHSVVIRRCVMSRARENTDSLMACLILSVAGAGTGQTSACCLSAPGSRNRGLGAIVQGTVRRQSRRQSPLQRACRLCSSRSI